eukprot:COSAG04_NODE_617_length_11897_cov_27.308696_12_plen_37_part_00
MGSLSGVTVLGDDLMAPDNTAPAVLGADAAVDGEPA